MANRRAYNRQHYKKHKKRILARNQKWFKKNQGNISIRFSRFKIGARQRKHGVRLSLAKYQALMSLPCFYCGGPLAFTGAGLDRIDSRKGYTSSNVRPCCPWCNRAKMDMTDEEFKRWIQDVYNNYIRREL